MANHLFVVPQLQHPLLTDHSKGLLEGARATVGVAQDFTKGVEAIRLVLQKGGGNQRLEVEPMEYSRSGVCAPKGDGFYVFRVEPKGANLWLFHAVSCVVMGGVEQWASSKSGAYEGYRVTVEEVQKRQRKRKRGLKVKSSM